MALLKSVCCFLPLSVGAQVLALIGVVVNFMGLISGLTVWLLDWQPVVPLPDKFDDLLADLDIDRHQGLSTAILIAKVVIHGVVAFFSLVGLLGSLRKLPFLLLPLILVNVLLALLAIFMVPIFVFIAIRIPESIPLMSCYIIACLYVVYTLVVYIAHYLELKAEAKGDPRDLENQRRRRQEKNDRKQRRLEMNRPQKHRIEKHGHRHLKLEKNKNEMNRGQKDAIEKDKKELGRPEIGRHDKDKKEIGRHDKDKKEIGRHDKDKKEMGRPEIGKPEKDKIDM